MRGADCWTDHRLIRAKFTLELRPPLRKTPPCRKLNCDALKSPHSVNQLREQIALQLSKIPETPADPDVNTTWSTLRTAIHRAAVESVGYTRRRHQDWFDNSAPGIHNLLQEKHKALAAHLSNPQSTSLKARFNNIRAETQRTLRAMKNDWWTKKAHEIQHHADTNNSHAFYDSIKAIYGPQRKNITPVRSADGTILYKDKQQILDRWAEHFNTLLNTSYPTRMDTLADLPCLPTVTDLDSSPSFAEVRKAIAGLKNNKSPGLDGVPAEILKHGGYLLTRRLHQLIINIWSSEVIPQDWKDANIITIFKRKGDKADCGNSRGISLLSVAGKVLARIMLLRLASHATNNILPETQCGFRQQRSTADMIFAARQIQEKCREHCKDLYLAFIDLSKAFDTVNRELLWEVLGKLGVPPKFRNILRQFHDGMQACVSVGGQQSPFLSVDVGVKQGCVLAPTIFNIFLSTVTLLSHKLLDPSDGVQIQYRLDGNLFNIRRLQAFTKTTTQHILELQYADNCALLAHSPESLQRALNVVASIYSAIGLQINIKKTQIVAQEFTPQTCVPTFTLNGHPLAIVPHFTYLGSILSPSCNIDDDIQVRIGLASAAFGRLSARVFQNRNLTTSTKAAVYRAVCLSTLLYGSETWTPCQRHFRTLEAFHIRCLQRILGVSWEDRVPYAEVFDRTHTQSIALLLAQKHLRWVGHVIRMPAHRLPRQILYGQLLDDQRSAGGPKKRYKDHLKTLLKQCNIPPTALESLAADRNTWSSSCNQGTTHLQEQATERRIQRRALRHQRAAVPTPSSATYPCLSCGKICGSRIGLHSHLAMHRRNTPQ